MLLTILLSVWMGIAIIVLFALLLGASAPYGRHIKKGVGLTMDNRLGWIVMELPALLVVPMLVIISGSTDVVIWIFVGLWIVHYGHRTLIFPFRLRTTGKKIPVAIVAGGMVFNLINGALIGYYLGYLASYSTSWLLGIPFLVGLLLFIIGMCINWWSDYRLINLRKPNEVGYKIPKGGLFRYISCPNHFGEMVEWLGFAVMTWSLPALSFFVWTVSNLLPRAVKHHAWYKEQFSDYPSSRRAVLPFIW